MEIQQLIKELISLNEQKNIEYLGNKILYDLCKKYPSHTNDQEIFAKIWLIGRSYAATLERGVGSNKDDNDLFYNKVVAKIKNSKIDDTLKKLYGKNLTLGNLNEILSTYETFHKLTQSFERGQKHSFCSKYLHFHFPDLFFIYDSRAVESISSLKLDISQYKEFKVKYKNLPYVGFYLRCFQLLRETVSYPNERNFSPRQIDMLLINMANEKKRTLKN